MALHLYLRRALTPSSISFLNLFPSSTASATATATLRSYSSLPRSSIITSPYSSYTWLVLPYSEKLQSVEHAFIPFIPKSKVVGPAIADTNIHGSTRGWLRVIDHEYIHYLTHPFLNKSIQLPDSRSLTQNTLSSSHPDSDEKCIFMAITQPDDYEHFRTTSQLIYWRPGKEEKWRFGPIEKDVRYDQLLYSGNDELFYTLTTDECFIRGWKVDWESMEIENVTKFCYKDFLEKAMEHKKTEKFIRDQCDSKRHYLVVDEASGDLLLVIKYTARHVAEDGTILYEDPTATCTYKTQRFDVLKVDIDGKKKLEHLKSIGDRVLFLGNGNESFCLLASKHMGLQRDSIYFTDDFDFEIFMGKWPKGGHDMGVYCLKNDRIIDAESCSFFAGLGKKNLPKMFWVAPSTELVSNH